MPNNLISPKNLRWLTVYLFLGLMVLLLALNFFVPLSTTSANNVTPTPTSQSSLVINCEKQLKLTCSKVISMVKAPKPTPILDTNKTTISIKGNDPGKLSQSDPGAAMQLEQQIKTQITQQGKQNRRAGIAIAYGGTMDSSTSNITQAQNIAKEVYKVLDMLGQQNFVFCHTAYEDPLFVVGQDPGTVVIDVFFYSQPAGGC